MWPDAKQADRHSTWAQPLPLNSYKVWVRPAQVGALFLHNSRVCLTFWHLMYPQNNVALVLHNLRVCWLFWVLTQYSTEGFGPGWWPWTGIDPSGSLGARKVLCSNPMVCQVKLPPLKLWQWAWLGSADGLSGWVCCYVMPSIYTYVLFFHL
jgi:hypothetical protein